MNEEERLRRAVARGAGEGEIRRLLALLEAQHGISRGVRTTGLSTSRTPTSTNSTVPVDFGCSVAVVDPTVGATFSIECDVQLDPSSDPVLVSVWATEAGSESRMLHEHVVQRGVVFKASGTYITPVTFDLRWRLHPDERETGRQRMGVSGDRSLRVTYEVPEAPVALVRRVPAPGDESHWYRGEANGQGVAVTACGVPITREETTFSTRREPAPPWVTCPVCLAAWRRA